MRVEFERTGSLDLWTRSGLVDVHENSYQNLLQDLCLGRLLFLLGGVMFLFSTPESSSDGFNNLCSDLEYTGRMKKETTDEASRDEGIEGKVLSMTEPMIN